MTTTKTILSVLSLWMMATTVLLCVVSIDAFTVQRSRSCTMSQQNDEQNTINMKQTKPLVVLSLSNDNNNSKTLIAAMAATAATTAMAVATALVAATAVPSTK